MLSKVQIRRIEQQQQETRRRMEERRRQWDDGWESKNAICYNPCPPNISTIFLTLRILLPLELSLVLKDLALDESAKLRLEIHP